MHMTFPLPLPDEKSREALCKAWERQDLNRYLQRWERSTVQEMPHDMIAFTWRACDIGCGFGKFLLRESEQQPNRAYLGIDKGNLRGGNMLKRFAAAGRENLFGIHGNITPILARFPEQFFNQITVLYPNPWWPVKHRKKRWAYHPILPHLVKLLKPGGILTVTSNEAFYLSEWAYTLEHHPNIADMVSVYAGPIQENEGRTHFETRFLEEGTPCGELRHQKKSDVQA